MKQAIVTGAASGIGAASAVALRKLGYTVIGIDLNDATGAADEWVPLDLDDPSASLPRFDKPVAALVNAAGLPPRRGTEAKVLRVNFLALRRLTHHVLPAMPTGSAIVNVASKAGSKWRENADQVRSLLAEPSASQLDNFVTDHAIDAVRSYDLSKEAVVTWTKLMTAELIERGIRMNAVSPAAVETPILGDFIHAFGGRAQRGIAMTKRVGRAEEIANVIAFLCTPGASWLNGCNNEVDGGLAAMLEVRSIRPQTSD